MEDVIINLLSNKDRPAKSAVEINDELGYTNIEDYKKLESLLDDMVKRGILYYSEKKKRYLLLENSHLLKGRLIMNHKGYGFVDISSKEDDIYINKVNLNGARNNDVVLIELIGDKTEGRIVKIISRDEEAFVGEVYFKDNKCYVKSDKKSNIDIEIPKEYQKGLVDGHKVLVKPISSSKYLGAILHIIGHKNDVGVDILSYVYQNNFKPEFSKETLLELDNIPDSISASDTEGRLDLRDELIYTIDGDDTKDIDDAISVKKLDNNNYQLGVHIADVSNYVREGSSLDKDAYERGTSVYLVDRVVPMLPHKLSNGICSLNPNVDRLAMSCIMEINNKGKVISYDIKKSVIRSRKQMTYNCVNEILDKNIIPSGYLEFADNLLLARELSDILRSNMVRRGYIEFKSPEAKIIVDEECHPIKISLRGEGTGENMIENFMVVANETVGGFIYYQNLPGIYRVHNKPDEKRLENFFNFLSVRGYTVSGKKDNITGKGLQNILKQLEDKPDSKVLNDLAIRSQAKAEYSKDNIGHFGLGSKCYSHFTSPIRRYPDLILHRLVKDYTDNYSEDVIEKWDNCLSEMARHCSMKEQDAVKCERDVDDMKKAEYMENHIGEVFNGVISGVCEFGIFVELDNTIEGLIKLEDLPKGGYSYNEKLLSLINRTTKKRYTFGSSIRVVVLRASKETAMIDFGLADK